MSYKKCYTNKCNIIKSLILLYVYYLSQNVYENINTQYDDLITYTVSDNTYEYNATHEDIADDEYTADEDNNYNISMYEHEDSSNYFQALTKAIFCLFD